MEISAKSKGLKYTLEVATEFSNLLVGDAAKISQILSNLLSNAINFTAQGEVKLRVSQQFNIEPKFRLFCEVTDTGIGILTSQQNLLFKPFTQVDTAMTQIFPGQGLGLAIAKQLVQDMQGKIGMNSQPGIGSTFWFWVDLAISEKKQKNVKQPLYYRFNADILVAEDYPVNQLIIQRFLEDLGCRVHAVNNGFEAVKALRKQSFDLVFMDCQMPFMDGYQASQEIRHTERNTAKPRIPIIALTAHALNEEEIKCKVADMDACVSKPFTRHDLSKILHKWLPKELVIANQPVLKTDVKTLAKASNVLDDTHIMSMKPLTQQIKLDNTDDLNFLNTLINSFQHNAAKTLSHLQHSIDNNDVEAIRIHISSLKSLSKTIGSGRLIELCTEMEQVGKTQAVEKFQDILDSMKQEYLHVLTELKNLCIRDIERQ